MARDHVVSRPIPELVDRLRVHVSLLGEYARLAFQEGDDRFLGEVAGKLRLLVIDHKPNIPLLLKLMEVFEVRQTLTIRIDGPPIQRRPAEEVAADPLLTFLDGPIAGDEVTVDEYLNLAAGVWRMADGSLTGLTKSELISKIAQQYGSAHEGWEIDSALHALRSWNIRIGGLPPEAADMQATTRTVLHVAERFLAMLTPELVATKATPRE